MSQKLIKDFVLIKSIMHFKIIHALKMPEKGFGGYANMLRSWFTNVWYVQLNTYPGVNIHTQLPIKDIYT